MNIKRERLIEIQKRKVFIKFMNYSINCWMGQVASGCANFNDDLLFYLTICYIINFLFTATKKAIIIFL